MGALVNKSDNKRGRIDKADIIEMYYDKHMKQADIARALDCDPAYINRVLKPFQAILRDRSILDAFKSRKVDLLNSIELTLLEGMVNEETLSKASLNNKAYSYQVIANQNRLEQDLSTSNQAVKMEFTVINSDQDRENFQK